MKILKTILLSSIIILSCEEKLVESFPHAKDFSIKITVTDSEGNSVQNISVSAWNKLPLDNYSLPKIHNNKDTQSGTTVFQFSLKEKNSVNMIAYDLENIIYDSIICQELNPGNYQVNWQNSEPNRVYKVVFEVISDSLIDSLNYRDSIYIVNHSIDTKVASIGKTDYDGKFETKNKLLFPILHNLPEFYRTGSAGPEIIGTFSFLDTVVIALHDTINNKVQYYNYLLMDGENDYSLNWNPSLVKKIAPNKRKFKISTISSIDSVGPVGIPMKNNFRQNYPNPFN